MIQCMLYSVQIIYDSKTMVHSTQIIYSVSEIHNNYGKVCISVGNIVQSSGNLVHIFHPYLSVI